MPNQRVKCPQLTFQRHQNASYERDVCDITWGFTMPGGVKRQDAEAGGNQRGGKGAQLRATALPTMDQTDYRAGSNAPPSGHDVAVRGTDYLAHRSGEVGILAGNAPRRALRATECDRRQHAQHDQRVGWWWHKQLTFFGEAEDAVWRHSGQDCIGRGLVEPVAPTGRPRFAPRARRRKNKS